MDSKYRHEMIYAGLMGVFVTFVVLTNTVGIKRFKLAIAAADTPLCYAGVWLVNRAVNNAPQSV